MDWVQIFTSTLGGVIGGSAVAGYLLKTLLNHKLNKRLAAFQFLLANRAKACAKIIESMGKVISASRGIVKNRPNHLRYYDELSDAAVQLEDSLRPAVFLLDEVTYERIHDFKTLAQSLHETILAEPEDSQNRHAIVHLSETLDQQRKEITKELTELMTDTGVS